MASLWKHPQSKFFTACWTDASGRRMKRSTKTTDKKLAEKLARQFEEESRAKRTAKQARRVLADIYRDLSGEELPAVTVREYFTGSDILTCGESGWPQGGEFHHHGGPGVGRFGGV
jgi:hypothetical protein